MYEKEGLFGHIMATVVKIYKFCFIIIVNLYTYISSSVTKKSIKSLSLTHTHTEECNLQKQSFVDAPKFGIREDEKGLKLIQQNIRSTTQPIFTL